MNKNSELCVRTQDSLKFDKIRQFLQNGSENCVPSITNLHILSAWKESTLLGHNCAVKKYLTFANARGPTAFKLPLSQSDVEGFCMWAGRNAYTTNEKKINGTSLKKYLIGLKAWHTFHAVQFPGANRDRLSLIIKASCKIDKEVPLIVKKPAVKLWHVVFLFNLLSKGNNFDRAVADMVVVAFWGMARLAELTYNKSTGELYLGASILTSDVTVSPAGVTPRTIMLSVRGAKTAKPGETQFILLGEQPNILCPVRAIERRLSEAGDTPTSLFGWGAGYQRIHVTRRRAVDRIQQALANGGHEHMLGHSFRVGGASFRNAYKMTPGDICVLGRWLSSSYKLYIREYTPEELRRTSKLLASLNAAWLRIEI
ncbi:hypothetical protein MJO28_012347 [Puccinia striiformis f. sp. tritici]|uniref:Uncharacterized protein n=1 Tax=Puccinia striiformis f. sp. tritici TaxID=168172 RepID=A0ACC0E1S5_9BASI|nr:hypothetical protein MJO28_012347 [Puccinia striiformis f. sp. tritici]KAI7945690.1 hypothetical protein MJO29_012078 [Puccinia striiformis f. sp. tritici]